MEVVHEDFPSITARKNMRTPACGPIQGSDDKTEGASVTTRGTTLLAKADRIDRSRISQLL